MNLRKALPFGAILLLFSCTNSTESQPTPGAMYTLQASEAVSFLLRAPEPEITTTTMIIVLEPPTTTTVPPTTATTKAPERPLEAPVRAGNRWDRLAECESGVKPADWHINTGNGYSGGLQFATSTWTNYNGQEYTSEAWQASREQQIAIAEKVLDQEGWNAWPSCSKKLGYQ